MSPHSETVFEAALALPAEERVALAEQLLDSVGKNAEQQEIDREWLEEIERRLRAFRAGEVQGIPAEEVFRALHERNR